MTDFPERPELPLTNARRVLVAVGAVMALAQVAAAFALAPGVTGPGDADAMAVLEIWAGCIVWSVVATLCLVRQADLPDIATAAMLVTIPAHAAFTFSAALDARGTDAEYNLVSAMFLGITAGALTAMLVWGIAMLAARALRLPTTERTADDADGRR